MTSTKKTSPKRRRRKKSKHKKKDIRAVAIIIIILAAITVTAAVAGYFAYNSLKKQPEKEAKVEKIVKDKPKINVQLLSVNEYSRPGLSLNRVNGIVVHYTANPGTTAIQNRDYFEGLKNTHATKASCHFIIGIDGEIVQCIPTKEMAYASNSRNSDTLAIECCIRDNTRKFSKDTYNSLIHLLAWLCGKFSLNPETDIIRHYDITGKLCPKYYVEHGEAWEKIRDDIRRYINKHGVIKQEK